MIKRLEEATKAGAAVVGVIFLFGFLVNALHLGKYGISGIALLRARYVLAGVWVVLPFVAAGVIVALLAYVVTFEYEEKDIPPAPRPYDLLLVTDSTVIVRDGERAIEVSRDAIETIVYPAP